MRAPQYARFKPQKRAHGAPRGVAGMPAAAVTNERGNHAPLMVDGGPLKVTLSLWGKSAKAMLGTGAKARPNPVASVAPTVQATLTEPARVMTATPARDRYKSRDDRYRHYAWGKGRLG